jgi:SnoaL-like domain
MSTKQVSTRRRFFGQAVALSVPLAGAGALVRAEHETAGDDAAARLAALEDANAIRALQQAYARLVNAGAHDEAARLFVDPAAAPRDAGLRRLAADRFAAHDIVAVASDGSSATARLDCTVEIETVIDGRRYTLIDMLREQGEHTLRALEQRVLESSYEKRGGAWKIASLALRPA